MTKKKNLNSCIRTHMIALRTCLRATVDIGQVSGITVLLITAEQVSIALVSSLRLWKCTLITDISKANM